MTNKNNINWIAVEKFIDEYSNSYEMIGEDDAGREGTYNPSENEIYMISDAIRGLLDNDEFLALLSSSPDNPSNAKPVAWIRKQTIVNTHALPQLNLVQNQVTLRCTQVEDDEVPLYLHPSEPLDCESIWNSALDKAIALVNERRTSEVKSKDLRSIANGIAMLKLQPAQTIEIKDHQIAAMVNMLTDIARNYHDHQSLRQHISSTVVAFIKDHPSDSQSEVSDAEKDAARYRWLRDESISKSFGDGVKAPCVFNVDDGFMHDADDHLEGEDLDKAVDAAMQPSKESP